VEDAACRHDVDLPLIATIRSRLEQGAQEHGDEDIAATFLTASR
jgi:3-hydroxyisobutyrate dehydrogenase